MVVMESSLTAPDPRSPTRATCPATIGSISSSYPSSHPTLHRRSSSQFNHLADQLLPMFRARLRRHLARISVQRPSPHQHSRLLTARISLSQRPFPLRQLLAQLC